MNAQLERLTEQLLRHTPAVGRQPTPIAGLSLVRRVKNESFPHVLGTPLVGITVQGDKHSRIAGREYPCRPGDCLITGVDIPTDNKVRVRDPKRPFLAIALDLNRELLGELIAAMPQAAPCEEMAPVAVAQATPKLLDVFSRLLGLLDEPDEIPVMAELLIREIHHRLLLSEQGAWLQTLCAAGSKGRHIANSISWLKCHFDQPFSVGELARQANMAESTFYRRFKQMTSLSPIQFQKQLRLNEARRLLQQERYDVGRAAFSVGYESPTQFIREYKRCFGRPPKRDVQHYLKSAVDF